MDIYMMRHGETAMNIERLLQGRLDTHLNEKGRDWSRECLLSIIPDWKRREESRGREKIRDKKSMRNMLS